ncbi:MAG: hypothetical protein KJ052_16955, partial [Candidatus Hydrogenedentes bacterium]|nr:hypothetical protein [Candidatus Hydrogenedentota bacterium]
YGLAEAVANISEDRDGVLRVDEDFAAVEFIPNGEGQGYRIIGTNLSNLATPLLRYDTMDLADLPDGADEAGEWGRRVATIDGRKEDYIVLSDGTRIGRMDHVFKDLVQITEAQLVQRAPGKVLVRIVRGAGYSGEDERALRRELRKRVGDLADFQIDYVEAIARSSTGKLRFVVSETPVDAAIPESEP